MSSDSDTPSADLLKQTVKETHVDDYPCYRGKVRDVYTLNEQTVGLVATDRISAFDHILREAIPFKGQILNQIASFFFSKVDDIVPTHIIDVPHPNLTIAKKCKALPVEVVVRGYLTGHAWRTYKSGKRELCGVALPEGMKEHEKFPHPILTPATKAEEGHDEDISEEEILNQKLVQPQIWNQVREYAFKLFERGTAMARKQGLILVDTKYEFGIYGDQILLIDEVHTADSSRYFFLEDYDEALKEDRSPKQLSKEFVREWLIEHDFQGLDGQIMPELPDEFRIEVYERYKELFELMTGERFVPTPVKNLDEELGILFKAY